MAHIFVIVWKDWKTYKIRMFDKVSAAWKYVGRYKIESYSVYYGKQIIDHSWSKEQLKKRFDSPVDAKSVKNE